MIAKSPEKAQSAKADLPAQETPSKKGAWFPCTTQDPRWTEDTEGKAAQGPLQAGSVGIVCLPVHISNENGAAPYPYKTVRRGS